MLDLIPETTALALIGAIGGIALGLAARLGRFCTLGAIEDMLYQNSTIRLRMWGLAIGVAGLCVYALTALSLFDPQTSIYANAPFSPVAHIAGGLLFGYGMALAGNCGFGALARFGGGDLRSFVIVLVMGLSGYIMLSGPLATTRIALVSATEVSLVNATYAETLSALISLPIAASGLILCIAICALALGSAAFLRSPKALLWAAVVGLAVASGWAGSAWIAREGFAQTQVVSHTFTVPIGETMLYAMTSSGGGLSFGVGSVMGVLAGAFLGSLIKGHFRWEACDDPVELKRQILGGILMGFGAVLALGCTVGQGISAFAVLSYGAPLTFLAIIAGAALGLRQLIEGFSFAR